MKALFLGLLRECFSGGYHAGYLDAREDARHYGKLKRDPPDEQFESWLERGLDHAPPPTDALKAAIEESNHA